MLGRITSYRRGRRTIKNNQAIIDLGLSTKEEANKKLGTKVGFKTKKSTIFGVISRVHGNSGRMVARFNRGLPGQAIGKDVNILKNDSKNVKPKTLSIDLKTVNEKDKKSSFQKKDKTKIKVIEKK